MGLLLLHAGTPGLNIINPNTLNPFWHLTAESITYNSITNLYGVFPAPVTGDGDGVEAMQDYGSAGVYSPAQSTVARKAIYKANILGGKGILRADQVDDRYLLVTPLPGANWNSFSLFVVMKANAASALFGVGATPAEDGAFTYRTNAAGKPEVLRGFVESLATGTNALPSGSFSLSEVHYDGATFSFFTNGVANGTTSISRTFSVAGTGFFQEAGFTLFGGDFRELYALPLLTGTQILGVRNYINAYCGGLF